MVWLMRRFTCYFHNSIAAFTQAYLKMNPWPKQAHSMTIFRNVFSYPALLDQTYTLPPGQAYKYTNLLHHITISSGFTKLSLLSKF